MRLDEAAVRLRLQPRERLGRHDAQVDPRGHVRDVQPLLTAEHQLSFIHCLRAVADDELKPEEAKELLASYGLKESGMERLIAATYRLLGLMSFLTAGETEVRAWTIPLHSKAVHAAGAIHSDFEKKFIRAEVVNWQALIDHNGYPGVKEKGILRLEGKEYIVKDGDVMVFKFNV